MQIAMLGLQGAGKKTLFQLMTGSAVRSVPPEGVPGKFLVRDPRVDRLHEMYQPEKTQYAKMDLSLLPDVKKSEGKASWLADIRDLDGLVCVVRAFEDPSVFHPSGAVDAMRDLELFMSELLFADILLMDQRVERLTEELKNRKTAEREAELEVCRRLARELEGGAIMRNVKLSDAEKRILSAYQFLTDKPVVAVVNVTQDADTAPIRKAVQEAYGDRVVPAFFDVKLEAEIAAIEDPVERAEFLKGLGIEEPAVAKLTRAVYDAMGLMSYFTVGTDEVRAWTIRKDSTAPQAARAIHSDLERGFIRVEVMKYDDLLSLGSEEKVKEAGKFMLKGKDYIVEEGDLLSFRAAT